MQLIRFYKKCRIEEENVENNVDQYQSIDKIYKEFLNMIEMAYESNMLTSGNIACLQRFIQSDLKGYVVIVHLISFTINYIQYIQYILHIKLYVKKYLNFRTH